MRPALAALIAALLLAALAVTLALGEDGDGTPLRPQGTAADRWLPLAEAGLERTEVAAARVGRHAYVVGGFEQGSGQTTAAVERYDLRRNSWQRVRSMPFGLNHPTAVTHGRRLYVSGGYRGRRDLSSATRALFEYDPVRDRWRRLPPAPTPRAAHAAAVIGRRLYVAGGANASGSLNTLEVYDFKRRRWGRGPAFPGPPRNHTTGIASGGRFYVLAGRDSANYANAERYNPRTRRWARMPPLRTARGGIASVGLSDGRIVVFGGENLNPGGTTIRPVELFDPSRRRWSSLPGMRTPRHGLGGVARGKRVYAIEGGPKPGFAFSGAIEYLDVR